MSSRRNVRGILVALSATFVAAVGVVALTSASWPIVFTSALFLAAAVLAADIWIFAQPIGREGRLGRWTLSTAIIVAAATSHVLAFSAGHSLRSDPATYTFVVTNSAGEFTLIRSVPYDHAQTDRSLEVGDLVAVKCSAEEGRRRWYKLADDQGWLRSDEAVPAPHTGQGSPPACPN